MDENGRENNQAAVNSIWRNIWNKQALLANLAKSFSNRLFVEGYPVIKKYIPEGKFHLLEIGTGTGRYGLALARDFPGSKFVLTDILEESLTIAKKLSAQLNLSNVDFVRADVFDPPFRENQFDIVLSDAVIQHLENYAGALRSIVKVLKTGGILIVSATNFWNPHALFKKIKGKNYEYGYDKSFKIRELANLARVSNCEIVATDGFSAAYSLYRYRPKFMKLIAWLMDMVVKAADSLSDRYFSKKFGFEIFVVAKKL